MKRTFQTSLAASAVLLSAALAITDASACSRITFVDAENTVVTGRTMDWSVDDDVVLRLMPRGVERKSKAKEAPASWRSEYGSVIAISFGTSLNSGMNEKGLVIDTLWLDVTNYGERKNGQKSVVGNEFPLYVLDNFANVEEVVNAFESGKVHIQQDKVPGTDKDLKIHFILTDKTGDNAVVEYVDGKMHVYRQKGRVAMTNDPTYEKMREIETQFRKKGMLMNMPGSPLAVDRYLRAVAWSDQVAADAAQDVNKTPTATKVLSIMRAVSTPLGVSDKVSPENCSTLWRAMADPVHGLFWIDSSFNLGVFSVDFSKLDFGGDEKILPVRKLPLEAAGDASERFELVEPLRF